MSNKILIVDDETVIQEMLKDVLKDAGHKVKVASSALEALKILENYDPDIIVSDIWMPEMDGHEFCKMARKTSNASILMMSGISSEISVLQKKQINADDILIKPFDVEDFLERIESLLKKRVNAPDLSYDDEQYLMQIYQSLSEEGKESLIREAERIAAGPD